MHRNMASLQSQSPPLPELQTATQLQRRGCIKMRIALQRRKQADYDGQGEAKQGLRWQQSLLKHRKRRRPLAEKCIR
ncbi:unnamed protein product [Sphagnum troendelagicum]|uniref:Uncharacterized protein n=1 Tax=Sphagnum troendelagicum TaxID=128251 RepID=A0ABP0UVL8_9BRYO